MKPTKIVVLGVVVWIWLLVSASGYAQTTQSPEIPEWVNELNVIAAQSENIFRIVATLATTIGGIIAIVNGRLATKKFRRELEILEDRARMAARSQSPISSILTDPRLSLALSLAMDFVIATVVTWLSSYALRFVTAPFSGTLGEWIYLAPQTIIVAAFFWPIMTKAKALRGMLVSVVVISDTVEPISSEGQRMKSDPSSGDDLKISPRF